MPSPMQEHYNRRVASLDAQPDRIPPPEANDTFEMRVRRAIAVIGGEPRRVLDFGCSYGAASKLLADAGHDVVGVDIAEPAIRHARRWVPSARFELIDSESHLPLPDASFDVCFCTETIEHLFDVAGFIAEVNRVLVDGGIFIITTPYHGLAKNLVIVALRFESHFNPTHGHIRFFTRASLERCLANGGFDWLSGGGVGRFWPFWKSFFVVARKRPAG